MAHAVAFLSPALATRIAITVGVEEGPPFIGIPTPVLPPAHLVPVAPLVPAGWSLALIIPKGAILRLASIVPLAGILLVRILSQAIILGADRQGAAPVVPSLVGEVAAEGASHPGRFKVLFASSARAACRIVLAYPRTYAL